MKAINVPHVSLQQFSLMPVTLKATQCCQQCAGGSSSSSSNDVNNKDSCHSSCIHRNRSRRRCCNRFRFSCCCFSHLHRMVPLLLLSTLALLTSLPYKTQALSLADTATTTVVYDEYSTTELMVATTQTTDAHLANDATNILQADTIAPINTTATMESAMRNLNVAVLHPNFDEDNEIPTILDIKDVKLSSNYSLPRPVFESSAVPSAAEDLEETIRHAVKTEIENEQNTNSSAATILNAWKNIQEADVRHILTKEILSKRYVNAKGTTDWSGPNATNSKLLPAQQATHEGKPASAVPDIDTIPNDNNQYTIQDLVEEKYSDKLKESTQTVVQSDRAEETVLQGNSVQEDFVPNRGLDPSESNLLVPLDGGGITEAHLSITTVTPEEGDNLSIVFEEPLSATEVYPTPFIEENVETSLKLVADFKAAPEIETTAIPGEIVHSIIKKQGVSVNEALDVLKEENDADTEFDINFVSTAQPETIDESDSDLSTTSTESQFDETTNELAAVDKVQRIEILETSSAVAEYYTTVSDSSAGAKGLRSLSVEHDAEERTDTAATLSEAFPPHDADQTFNKHVAAESTGEVGSVLSVRDNGLSRAFFIVVACSSITVLFIVASVAMFLISFQRQHGTLDIEMQERRCGKDDEDADTCQKLLEIELPATVIAIATDETDECL